VRGGEAEKAPSAGSPGANPPEGTLRVLIASFIEAEQVERIRAVDPRLEVIYEPELLRPPRYAADHKGGPLERTREQEARWRALLGTADILFDFDQTHLEDLPELAPRVRWIQSTSSGIGPFVQRMGYAHRMPDTVFTRASGVHAQPLAEFCILVMLLFRKKLHRVMRGQARKHWERYAGTDLEGKTVVVVGLGGVGREVVRVAKAFRMRVIGVDRPGYPLDAEAVPVDEFLPSTEIHSVLGRAEHLVLIAPHTPETEGMIGARELALMPPGAVLINIARGALVDEVALVEALRSGHLAGAGLDVFAEEPLPPESPFWEMPNVLVSPHSASTSDGENRRITDLFCENLRRYLGGEPLINLLDLEEVVPNR
jgi:phosphoglycerate dehydrogenase-like enzyme